MPIDRFVQAVNQGDSQTFLSFFPKDGVVIDSGWRFTSHDAIRGWSDREFIGAQGWMTVENAEQKNFYSGPARFDFALDGKQVRELYIKGK